jgi:hypothetical protein
MYDNKLKGENEYLFLNEKKQKKTKKNKNQLDFKPGKNRAIFSILLINK